MRHCSTTLRQLAGWLTAFAAFAGLAHWGQWVSWQYEISAALRGFGESQPQLQWVWIVGGIPITGLALVFIGVLGRRRMPRVWAVLIAGSVLEVVVKHVLPTPLPRPVAIAPAWARLEATWDIGPAAVGHALHKILPALSPTSTSAFLRGSYPSGHTYRLSYVAGIALGRCRWPWMALWAAAVAFCVTATGGHWLGDAVGGFALAMAGLAAAGKPRPK